MKKASLFFFLSLAFLSLSSCFGSGDDDNGSDGGETSESPECTSGCSEEEDCSSALETKDSNWNQSIVLSGEGTTTTTREITVTLSARSDRPITAYYLSEDSTEPTRDSGLWTSVDPAVSIQLLAISYQLSAGNGEKTLYGWFKDECGDVSPVSSLTVTLDSSEPEDNEAAGSGGSSGGDSGGSGGGSDSGSGGSEAGGDSGGGSSGGDSGSESGGGDAGGGGDSGGSGGSPETPSVSTGSLSGSLSLAGGSSTTNSLTISATITGAGTTPVVAYLLSETNSAPAADSPLWNTISSPSTTVLIEATFTLSASAGSHAVYGWLKSQSGRVSEVFLDTIEMVLPAPSGGGSGGSGGSSTGETPAGETPSGETPASSGETPAVVASSLVAGLSINSGVGFTNSRTVSLSLSGLGTNNITQYEVTEASSPLVGEGGGEGGRAWTSVTPATSLQLSAVSYQLSANDGAKTLYLHIKDSANNTASANASITLDTTPPAGSLVLDSGAKLTVDSTVAAGITGSDALGVVGYYMSSSSTPPGANDPGWVAVVSVVSYQSSVDRNLTDLTGLSTQYLWLKDAAGNVSSTASDSIEVVRIYSTNSSNDLGSYSSIAVDSNNRAYISNYQAYAGDLIYDRLVDDRLVSGGVDINITADIGAGTSIAIDSNNKLHIAYRDVTNSTLKYATNAGGSWAKSTIESGGISPSIGVDSNGKVHISHIKGASTFSSAIRYATNTSGVWTLETAIAGGNQFVLTSTTSLSIDSQGKIHIAADSLSPMRLYHATNASGSWQSEVVDSRSWAGLGQSITTDGDSLYISYWQNNTVQVAENNGSGWSLTQIDSSSGTPTSIAIDSLGFIHIGFYDYANSDLKYATNYSGSWTTMTLDSSGDVGDYCDLAIDSNDRLHISYYDATNGDLKYATTAD